jgi:hypothetical protein
MIPWDGGEMYERIRRGLAGLPQPTVTEMDRCVNEGAKGCTVRAGASGWCPACWATIVPES